MIKSNLNKILLKSTKLKSLIIGKTLNFRIVFTIVLFITLFNNYKLSAKLNSPTDNIVIIDSLLNDITVKSFLKLKSNIKLSKTTTIFTKTNILNISDNIEMAVLKNIDLLKQKPEQKILINPLNFKKDSTSNYNLIFELYFNNFEITYIKIESNDMYLREIKLDFHIIEEYTNYDVTAKGIYEGNKHIYQDTISEAEINQVENSNFPITQGKKNKEESNFLDDILEPIIITGTIAVTVILLFTIRSN